MIAFTIPGEPVAFARCRTNGKRHFTPEPQRSFMTATRIFAAEAMHRAGMQPIDGPIRVTVRAEYLVPQSWSKKRQAEAVWKDSKPDADNIAKIIKDGMNKIVYRDDAQVAELIVQKRYGLKEQVTVSIEILSGD